MKTKLSPPWVIWANELKALFSRDKGVMVITDWEEMSVRIYVSNGAKADALTALLPAQKDFGNVSLSVTVIPGNAAGDRYTDLYRTAFDGNDLYVETVGEENPLGTFTYVIWQAAILQFFADDLGDVAGNRTLLAADAARDVLIEQTGVWHCTEDIKGTE